MQVANSHFRIILQGRFQCGSSLEARELTSWCVIAFSGRHLRQYSAKFPVQHLYPLFFLFTILCCDSFVRSAEKFVIFLSKSTGFCLFWETWKIWKICGMRRCVKSAELLMVVIECAGIFRMGFMWLFSSVTGKYFFSHTCHSTHLVEEIDSWCSF